MGKTKVLITGGAGFIPSSLAKALSENEEMEIVLIDNFLTGRIENIPTGKNIRFIKGDVNNYSDISQIMLSNKFDYVFHYAAVVGVLRTVANPLLVLNDIKGINNILGLCVNTGVKRIFFSSSSEVYGEPVELPQNEDRTPLNSKLPYAIVKNLGEAYLKAYFIEHGLPYTIFRFFNTYGPNQSADFVVSKYINAALKNEPLCIYGDGTQSRTFCFIKDNIETTLNCLYKEIGINEIINVGSENVMSIELLAKEIISLTKSKSKIVFVDPLKEGDMTRRQPDNLKMKQILGRELISFNEGMRITIEEILKGNSNLSSVG